MSPRDPSVLPLIKAMFPSFCDSVVLRGAFSHVG